MAVIRKVVRVSNPRRYHLVKRVVRRTGSAARKRQPNPVLIELGMLNPKRSTTMATRRKIRRARRTARRTRRNPVVIVTRKKNTHRRRSTGVARRRRTIRSYRRNPSVFGRSGGKSMVMMVGGGLLGVAATKFLPTLLPGRVGGMLGSGPIMNVIITGAGAFVASWLVGKLSSDLRDPVLLGGLMQTASVALNAFAPGPLAQQLALRGVGDIVPTGPFPVPANQFRNNVMALPAPGTTATGKAGVGTLRRYGNFR